MSPESLWTSVTHPDFRHPHAIGERINDDDAQLAVTGGYDHAFALRHVGSLDSPAAILYDAQSGRVLTVYTTEPAIQIYTGNGLKRKSSRKEWHCLQTTVGGVPRDPPLLRFTT